jgi:lipoprotein-anchoring transpeptidase ErfK/SrfK
MADYYSVMLGAVGKLDPNTVDARRSTYHRARRAMLDRLQGVEPRLPNAVIDAELEGFEQAIERVEAQYGGGAAEAAPRRFSERRTLPSQSPEPQASEPRIPEPRIPEPRTPGQQMPGQKIPGQRRSIVGWVMTGLAIAGVVIAVGLAALMFGPRIKREPQAAQTASTPAVSYVYLRQPVYFRTTEPVGTILIDKSQRFIYVVLPNVVALRYGMGIGPECTTAAGLYRVSRKEEWPGRSNSTIGQLRGLFGGEAADNPLGPRALYFGTEYRLHGTNAPLSIGSTLPAGCFALLNETITEFYDKAPVETRVVVMD